MQPRVGPHVGGHGACRRTDQGAHAPHPVQPGHDRLVEAVLHLDTERVHRHVRHAGRRPVDEERRAQREQVRGQGGQDQGQRPQGQQSAQRGPGAEAVADRAGERHRERGADGREGQGDTELPGADPGVVLDPGHPRGETAGHRAVHREDRGDGVPGPPHFLGAEARSRGIRRHTACPPLENPYARFATLPGALLHDAGSKLSGTLPDK